MKMRFQQFDQHNGALRFMLSPVFLFPCILPRFVGYSAKIRIPPCLYAFCWSFSKGLLRRLQLDPRRRREIRQDQVNGILRVEQAWQTYDEESKDRINGINPKADSEVLGIRYLKVSEDASWRASAPEWRELDFGRTGCGLELADICRCDLRTLLMSNQCSLYKVFDDSRSRYSLNEQVLHKESKVVS